MNIKSPKKSDIPMLRSLWSEAFGDTDEFLDVFFKTAFDESRAMFAVADNKAVGALYWFCCEHLGKPVAYIYAVATAREFRGQGVCHSLMEYTHKHLKELGYAGAILVPGSRELFDFYKGMGYETCSYVSEVKCTAGAEVTELQVVDKLEYAKLRRELLPEGGVVQEKESIDFLSIYATLYRGTDFVLAGFSEGGFFHGVEFLGDVDKTPKIIKALGCKEGTFRTYGTDKPFAMYYSLDKNNTETPRYFGLAFD